MGVVRRQAIYNTLLSYMGVALGAVNTILLYPAYFSTEEYGLVRLLISISTLYTQFAVLGLSHSAIRFTPYFRQCQGNDLDYGFSFDENNPNLKIVTKTPERQGAFGAWIILFVLAGFALTTLAYIGFHWAMVDIYQEKSALYLDYYYTLIPLSFMVLFINLFDSFAASALDTVFPAFVREVFIRAVTTVFIFAYAWGYIDFEVYVYYYIALHAVSALMLSISVLVRNKIPLIGNLKLISRKEIKDFMQYGLLSLLSSGSNLFVSNIDGLMLAAMVGLDIVGIYGTYLFVAIVVSIPSRSFIRITRGIISDLWQKGDLAKVNEIYKQTALIQFILGCWIFIGIWANEHNLITLLRNPEFAPHFGIFIFLGLGFLIEAGFGVNHQIIVTSDKYYYDLYLNAGLVALTVLTNYLLIPLWGGVGSAIATCFSVFCMNLGKWYFVKYHFNMQPFVWGHLKTIVVSAGVLGLNYVLPQLSGSPKYLWLAVDLGYRSILLSAVFFGVLWLWDASPDLSSFVRKIRIRFGLLKS